MMLSLTLQRPFIQPDAPTLSLETGTYQRPPQRSLRLSVTHDRNTRPEIPREQAFSFLGNSENRMKWPFP
jgi:hypothetical protein